MIRTSLKWVYLCINTFRICYLVILIHSFQNVLIYMIITQEIGVISIKFDWLIDWLIDYRHAIDMLFKHQNKGNVHVESTSYHFLDDLYKFYRRGLFSSKMCTHFPLWSLVVPKSPYHCTVVRPYDSIRGLTCIWWTKWCKLKVRDFIHEKTFSRVKLCVETESDIKNAQLPTWKFFP